MIKTVSDNLSLVEIEVMRGRLQAVVDEAGDALVRTAFSHIVRDAKDFACAVLTPDGRTVSQSAQSIPVFLGSMTHTASCALALYPLDTWEDGDIVGTNDPWQGTGHLFDLTCFSPIWVNDELVALAGVVAHLPDIGGRGMGIGARDVFEEGLRIPMMRLARGGHLDSVLRSVLLANVRLPEEVEGDLGAIQNALYVVGEGVKRLLTDRGVTLKRYRTACDELERRSEDALRRAIQAMPDGTYRASIESEGVAGIPFGIKVAVDVQDDNVIIDLAGSSEQVAAGINSSFVYTRAYCVFAIKCLLAPELPFNQGILAPIKVTAPERSIVNSSPPAACSSRNLVGHFIPTLIFEALADAVGDRAIAQCGAPRPVVSLIGSYEIGDQGSHKMYSFPLLVMGGFGARAQSDGPSGVAFPTNTEAISTEVAEVMAPLFIAEKELVPDTGGAGKYRGGLGQRVTVTILEGTVQAQVQAQLLNGQTKGIFGGSNGGGTRIYVDGRQLDLVPPELRLDVGVELTVESPGGGGYGDSAMRDSRLVELDRLGAYVTSDTADPGIRGNEVR